MAEPRFEKKLTLEQVLAIGKEARCEDVVFECTWVFKGKGDSAYPIITGQSWREGVKDITGNVLDCDATKESWLYPLPTYGWYHLGRCRCRICDPNAHRRERERVDGRGSHHKAT